MRLTCPMLDKAAAAGAISPGRAGAPRVFRDSMPFPVALTALGLAVIASGVAWQRNEAALGERLRSRLPADMGDLLAHRAG